MRFIASTIGCKVNQYETRSAAALLSRLGLCEIDAAGCSEAAAPADLVLVNTCCVTAAAAAKSRRAIRRALRRHRKADLLILGCCATRDAQLLRQVARQAGAVGNVHVAGHHDDVAECIRRAAAALRARQASELAGLPKPFYADTAQEGREPHSGDHGRNTTVSSVPAGPFRYDGWIREGSHQRPAGPESILACHYDYIEPRRRADVKDNIGTADLPSIASFSGHQRAFVKVQDGCDAFCAYCVIPLLRRRVWSRPMQQVLDEVRTLVGNGHREVVLCGVFLGGYGQETTSRRRWRGPSALPQLLRRVAGVDGLWRVRLSSLECGDVTDELLEVFGTCPAAAPHFHLSLQSGSERILRRMNRRYTPGEFLDAVGRIRAALDRPGVTTDVIVGFPGESDADFEATLDVARQAGFSRIHIFPFSACPGTAAWEWRREAPPPEVTKARFARLAELARRSARAFRRQFLGQTVELLVEQPNSKTPTGCARGLTDRYLEVAFRAEDESPAQLVGRVLRVRIDGLSAIDLSGELPEALPSGRRPRD